MFANHEVFESAVPALSCEPAQPVRTPVRKSSRAPQVLYASFSHVRRYRDYCRVEAIVTVTFRYHPALPPRTERLLTAVPILPEGQTNRFRERLIESAINLSVLMHRAERGVSLRTF